MSSPSGAFPTGCASRMACVEWAIFLDFADPAQQVGPPPNRGTGLPAVFGVKDGHIVLDPPLLLADRLNRLGDMHFVAIVPEYRISRPSSQQMPLAQPPTRSCG